MTRIATFQTRGVRMAHRLVVVQPLARRALPAAYGHVVERDDDAVLIDEALDDLCKGFWRAVTPHVPLNLGEKAGLGLRRDLGVEPLHGLADLRDLKREESAVMEQHRGGSGKR